MMQKRYHAARQMKQILRLKAHNGEKRTKNGSKSQEVHNLIDKFKVQKNRIEMIIEKIMKDNFQYLKKIKLHIKSMNPVCTV